MQNRPLRGLIGLAAIGAATAVGITTHDAGFTALTFIGTLVVPRILGIGGRRWHGGACAGKGGHREHVRDRFEQRLESWHRQAHGEPAGEPSPPSSNPAVA
jgi:hypothetical protein